MPAWQVKFEPAALDDLDRLDMVIREQMLTKLEWLAKNFHQITPLPLEDKWAGFFKLRAGDYRAIYAIENTGQQLVVIAVGHRSKVYKRQDRTKYRSI